MGLLDFLKDIDVKDKVGDFWEYIDDPVKNILGGLDKPRGAVYGGLKSILDETPNNSFEEIIRGFKHPEQYQPNTGNRALDIGLSAALDPLTYIPAANITKLRLLKPLAPVLGPIAGTQASLGKRVGAELATNIAARTGSEVGAKVTEGTPLEGVGSIIGGLGAGIAVGGRLTVRREPQVVRMTEDQLNEEFQHIADSVPSTITKYQVVGDLGPVIGIKFDTLEEAQLAQSVVTKVSPENKFTVQSFDEPNPFAPEYQYKERDIPITLDNNTQIIERGQPVWNSKEQARFDADQTLQKTDELWLNNSKHWSEIEDPRAFSLMNSWEEMDNQVPLRKAIKNKEIEDLFALYDEGGVIRAPLHEVSDDGYVTLYRGESRVTAGKFIPQFERDQLVQSFSSWPRGAAMFTSNIDNLDIIDKVIMKVRVPIDDIMVSLKSSRYPNEHEFIVLTRNNIDDELYKSITGLDKSTARTPTWEVFNKESNNVAGTFDSEEAALRFIREGTNPTKIAQLDDEIRQAKDTQTVLMRPENWDKVDEFNEANAILQDLETRRNQLGASNKLDYNIVTKGHTLLPTREVEVFGGVSSLLENKPLVPIELTKQNAGNELIQAVVGEPVMDITQQQYLTPPISGGASMEKYHNILTSKGIDKKVAAQLEGMTAKDRKDMADMFVNEQAAHGIPEDIVRLIFQGYEKVGITNRTKIAKLNNALRGTWATGDGSWFGIQGLLSIPRMLVKGDLKDAWDTLTLPMITLIGNKTAMTKYVRRVVDNIPEGAPTLFEAQQAGLHLAFLKGNVDFNFTFLDKLPFFKPDKAFMAAGDVARVSMFYNEWMRYGAKGKGSIEQIATAVNRATGIAEHPFGGQIGSFALFAPRFFQSQLEIITKAFTDGTIEGTLARRQLLALIGTGSALTFAANYVRGYSPFGVELEDIQGDNPLEQLESILSNPNFMRIRNIEGNDISVFGPWDSLLKLTVHLASGDLGYARTKFGPLASLATNIITGETFIGDPVQSNPYKILGEAVEQVQQVASGEFNLFDMDSATKNTLKSLFFPFAWQQVGRESMLNNALNFFGVKNSPLSRVETIDVNMTNLGLDPNDPLDRRQYLTEYPEYRSVATEVDRTAIGYREDIQSRREYNEQATLDGSKTLVEFRENRKILSRELRSKLETLYRGRDDFKADTPQKRWVDSYFKLFEQSQDPITHDIVGPKFDHLQAQWIEANGDVALDYVNRYLQIDKGDIELQYLSDMQELDRLGYFDTQKYTPEVYQLSGLTDEQIDDYRDRVSAARSVNPVLASKSFKQALREVLSGELTEDQIWAIDRAGSQSSANPDIAALKDLQPQLFQWFNPNATWSTYLEATNEAVELPSSTLAIPSIR